MSVEQELDGLYREIILDHYRNPRNPEPLQDAQITGEGFNPFCGDQVTLGIKLNSNGKIEATSLQGRGCSISLASASMLTEVLKGKTLKEAEATNEAFRRLMHGEPLQEADLEALGELEALKGVRKFPIRIKCALLAWTTMEEGLEEFRRQAE